MNRHSLSHVDGLTLLRETKAAWKNCSGSVASFLSRLAEVDERKQYVPEGFESMQRYCEDELEMAEDCASRHIRAARLTRQFPALLDALADGRLYLSGVLLLAPHLSADSVDEWVSVAARKSKAQIRDLVAHRTPKLDLSATPTAHASSDEPVQEWSKVSAPERMEVLSPEISTLEIVPSLMSSLPIAPSVSSSPPGPTPSTPTRRSVVIAVDDEMNQLLRRAVELLGYKLRSGDPKEVVRQSLRHFVRHLEGVRPLPNLRPLRRLRRTKSRYVPVEVREAVWNRDEARCTFVSDSGRRCAATQDLEFDHIVPFARGGATSEENLRLRCPAHNQFAAECAFGSDFMRNKREMARLRAAP